MNNIFTKNKVPLAYSILFLFSVVFIGFNINHKSVWFDEIFSLELAKTTYKQIWTITADDVHPPLYYWMLKAFSQIFGYTISVSRFFSAIPIFLGIAMGYTHIRKLWSNKVAFYFMLLMLLHPAMHYPTYDIRMYSWALFFVLTTYIYAYKFLKNLDNKDLIVVLIFALLSAYTHYYALLAVAGIFLVLSILIYNKKRDKLWILFGVGLCFIVGYSPWLIHLFSQVSEVSEDYWIKDVVNWGNIFYLLSPFRKLQFVGYILIPAIIFSLVYTFRSGKHEAKCIKEGLIALLVFLIPSLVGLIFSLTIRPVFINRYLYPSIGIFFIAFAILFSSLSLKNKGNLAIVVLFFGFTTFETIRATKKETQKFREIEARNDKFNHFISEVGNKNFTFVHHYKSPFEIPYWITNYPSNNHIAKVIPDMPRNQVLEFIKHQNINSFEELSDKEQTILIECQEYLPFATSSQDSIDITQHYEIVRKISDYSSTLYQLERKR